MKQQLELVNTAWGIGCTNKKKSAVLKNVEYAPVCASRIALRTEVATNLLWLRQTQDPSLRFVDLLRRPVAEVREQFTTGVSALEIAGRIKRVYLVLPRRYLVPILPATELAGVLGVDVEEIGQVVVAALAGNPSQFVATCRVCGRPFIQHNTRQAICRRRDACGKLGCVLAAGRERAALRLANTTALPAA